MSEVLVSEVAGRPDCNAFSDFLRYSAIVNNTASDYPGHELWIQKTQDHLHDGRKRAFAAYCGHVIVGGVVCGLSADAAHLEIRHLSVLPEFRARHIGSLLLRTAERRAVEDWSTEVSILDTKSRNTPFIHFAERQGYMAIAVSNLYGQPELDVVFAKSLAEG